jgi:small subunit ribosomal protein S17
MMMHAEASSLTAPRPQRLRGVVVGAKHMAKTITVAVERRVWHRKLRKQFRKTKTFLVHDERGEAHVGDAVVIEQTRPMSRQKHFRLMERTPRRAVPRGAMEPEGETP